MNKPLLRKITSLVGGLAIAAATLIFALVGDLVMKVGSAALIVLMITGLGSAVCFFLAENYLEKPKTYYILKGMAILLAVIFILFLVLFFSWTTLATPDKKTGAPQDPSVVAALNAFSLQYDGANQSYKSSNIVIYTIFIALSAIGLIAQGANVAIFATLKEE